MQSNSLKTDDMIKEEPETLLQMATSSFCNMGIKEALRTCSQHSTPIHPSLQRLSVWPWQLPRRPSQRGRSTVASGGKRGLSPRFPIDEDGGKGGERKGRSGRGRRRATNDCSESSLKFPKSLCQTLAKQFFVERQLAFSFGHSGNLPPVTKHRWKMIVKLMCTASSATICTVTASATC